MIKNGDEAVYPQLFTNLRPIILFHARGFLTKMETYNMDDFLQEGNRLIRMV